MKLTDKQVEFLVEYFHEHEPDYDGYLGPFSVEEKVMERFREKYLDEWDLNRHSPWRAWIAFTIAMVVILAVAWGAAALMHSQYLQCIAREVYADGGRI